MHAQYELDGRQRRTVYEFKKKFTNFQIFRVCDSLMRDREERIEKTVNESKFSTQAYQRGNGIKPENER